jgi:hypothetical protein
LESAGLRPPQGDTSGRSPALSCTPKGCRQGHSRSPTHLMSRDILIDGSDLRPLAGSSASFVSFRGASASRPPLPPNGIDLFGITIVALKEQYRFRHWAPPRRILEKSTGSLRCHLPPPPPPSCYSRSIGRELIFGYGRWKRSQNHVAFTDIISQSRFI